MANADNSEAVLGQSLGKPLISTLTIELTPATCLIPTFCVPCPSRISLPLTVQTYSMLSSFPLLSTTAEYEADSFGITTSDGPITETIGQEGVSSFCPNAQKQNRHMKINAGKSFFITPIYIKTDKI